MPKVGARLATHPKPLSDTLLSRGSDLRIIKFFVFFNNSFNTPKIFTTWSYIFNRIFRFVLDIVSFYFYPVITPDGLFDQPNERHSRVSIWDTDVLVNEHKYFFLPIYSHLDFVQLRLSRRISPSGSFFYCMG